MLCLQSRRRGGRCSCSSLIFGLAEVTSEKADPLFTFHPQVHVHARVCQMGILYNHAHVHLYANGCCIW